MRWWEAFVNKAGALICKRLRRPGVDSEGSIPPAYVAWRTGTTNRVVVNPPARLGIDASGLCRAIKRKKENQGVTLVKTRVLKNQGVILVLSNNQGDYAYDLG
jgi:hypothetical protein